MMRIRSVAALGAACVACVGVTIGMLCCTAQAQRIDAASVSFDASIPPALEVKRAPTGHLLVRPVINGKEAGWFIFDTGAGICCVDPSKVEALGLTDAGAIDSVGVGGGQNSKLVNASAMRLGPATFSDHVLMVTDLSFLTPHLGEEISGVIGYGVMSRCVTEIDLEKGTVSIHDPAESVMKDLPWEELNVKDRIPVVHARFEGHEGLFRIDTGAKGTVTFHEPAVRKWKLIEGREVTDSKMGGVGGFVASKQGELEWFEVGGVRTDHVSATFAIEAKGTFADATKDGNIGVELLKPFVIWFDYAGGRVAFVKRPG